MSEASIHANPVAMVKGRGRAPSLGLLSLMSGHMIRSLASMGYHPQAIADHVLHRTQMLQNMDEADAAAAFLRDIPEHAMGQA